ncbi:hypothetical protein [Sphingobium olei]|uniref:DUF3298 domain-containing protein n=1 Tax=Sphingobium olei TaxID=420955 RepID=A0ABW3NXZ8_9SPHN
MVKGSKPEDKEFSAFMRQKAEELRQGFYRGDNPSSFERWDEAGSVDVIEHVIAASPDVVSVLVEASFYYAGAAHPGVGNSQNVIWSRRLHRPLSEEDVFAIAPDRTLRRIALAQFDNRDGLTSPDDLEGIPLSWERTSIGSKGITWSFDPYELGGYLSGGSTTISWSALQPYLRSDLPFSRDTIRAAPE